MWMINDVCATESSRTILYVLVLIDLCALIITCTACASNAKAIFWWTTQC